MSISKNIELSRQIFENSIYQNYQDAKNFRDFFNPHAAAKSLDRNKLFERTEHGYAKPEVNALWVNWYKTMTGQV